MPEESSPERKNKKQKKIIRKRLSRARAEGGLRSRWAGFLGVHTGIMEIYCSLIDLRGGIAKRSEEHEKRLAGNNDTARM